VNLWVVLTGVLDKHDEFEDESTLLISETFVALSPEVSSRIARNDVLEGYGRNGKLATPGDEELNCMEVDVGVELKGRIVRVKGKASWATDEN
jgi:hypothetical protein